MNNITEEDVPNIKILVVEDDKELLQALMETLELEQYQVTGIDNLSKAYEFLTQNSVDLVISDVNFKNNPVNSQLETGIDLLRCTRQNGISMPFVLTTAYASVDKAVEALKLGALDYLVKPFEAEQLLNIVHKNICIEFDDFNFVAVDDESVKIKRMASQVAKTDASVLINGESGTGKEVLAQYIHHCSPRSDAPFVAINCAAIPENMLEAILFGYEKGAYTGAYASSPGKFEQAQGGTLLLDEISEMDISLQAKLLRVLQEKQVERLGGKKVIDLDVRILATTNRNLKQEVGEGRFREDLYYRLSVFPIVIKPLRDRKEDILPILESLLRKHSKSSGLISIDESAKETLLNYHWPGNVREVDNVVQRAIVLANGGMICREHIIIEDSLNAAEPDKLLHETNLKENETNMILHALEKGNGSRKYAAEKLGISPRTLRYKLAKLKENGVDVPPAFGAV